MALVHGELSEYEKMRKKNVEENRRMLESLGLLRSFKPILNPPKAIKVEKRVKKPEKIFPAPHLDLDITPHLCDNAITPVRRSLRVKGLTPDLDSNGNLPDESEEEEEPAPSSQKPKRENAFGHIEGVPIGTHWWTRMECSRDGVHRPTVAGIHGSETEGCYSIALSGGYEDDIDLGESFTYTGEGGRDLKGTKANPKNLRTAPQSKDQRLTKGNLALSMNIENRRPVRVIRGYKLPSLFAPEYGYRYDGLYSVEKCWSCPGLSGFLVYKFIFKRLSNQSPPPWTEQDLSLQESDIELESAGKRPKLMEEGGELVGGLDGDASRDGNQTDGLQIKNELTAGLITSDSGERVS